MSNTAPASQRGRQRPLPFLDTLSTVAERTIGRRGQHPLDDEARLGHMVGRREEASDASSRQETETDDVYGDLPVLREHQYGAAIISSQV